MELREGHQSTEIVAIPEDWSADTILGLSTKIMDFRGRTPGKLGMEWGKGDIPALSAGNVKKGFIDFSAECYFGSEELYRRWMTRGDVSKGDVVFTTCRVPDDWLLKNKRPLLHGREVLQAVLATWQSRAKELPC